MQGIPEQYNLTEYTQYNGITASFVEGALRELSVGLLRGDYFLYRVCVGMLARSSRACFMWPGPQMSVVQNNVLADVMLLLSGLDGAVCYQIGRADGLAFDSWLVLCVVR
jgi:hypothetical protein